MLFPLIEHERGTKRTYSRRIRTVLQKSVQAAGNHDFRRGLCTEVHHSYRLHVSFYFLCDWVLSVSTSPKDGLGNMNTQKTCVKLRFSRSYRYLERDYILETLRTKKDIWFWPVLALGDTCKKDKYLYSSCIGRIQYTSVVAESTLFLKEKNGQYTFWNIGWMA